jgi:hypothetical protein
VVSADAGVWLAQEVVNALCDNREHACSGPAGRTVLEMILGCYAAQVAGTRVPLPLADRAHPLQRLCDAAGIPVPAFRIWKDAEYLAAEEARLGA